MEPWRNSTFCRKYWLNCEDFLKLVSLWLPILWSLFSFHMLHLPTCPTIIPPLYFQILSLNKPVGLYLVKYGVWKAKLPFHCVFYLLIKSFYKAATCVSRYTVSSFQHKPISAFTSFHTTVLTGSIHLLVVETCTRACWCTDTIGTVEWTFNGYKDKKIIENNTWNSYICIIMYTLL